MTPAVYSLVLRKSFINRFFEENALFFFLVIGVAGGVMSGNEHVALATFFVTYPILTLIPAFLWVLYGIKVIAFNRGVMREPVMSFVHVLTLAPVKVKVPVLFAVVLTQSLPVIIYGAFMILIAFRIHMEKSSVVIITELLVLLLLLTLDLYNTLQARREKKSHPVKRLLDRTLVRSFPQMFLEWALRRQPGLVLAAKIFNCLILFGICKLYEYESYDLRFLAMAGALTWGTSMTVVYQFVNFENDNLSLTRNLPIPMGRRMLLSMVSILLAYLPECVLVARNFPEALTRTDFIQFLLLGISVHAVGYCSLIKAPMSFDRFSQFVFAATLGLVVTILFRFPLYLLTAIGVAFSAYAYPKYFYRYESKSRLGEPRSSANNLTSQDHFVD